MSKISTIAVLAGLSSLLLTGCGHHAKDFNGSWEGDSIGINSFGDVESRQRLELTSDDKGRLTGTIAWWKAKGHNPAGEVVEKNTEGVIGLADLDAGTFMIVETAESGTLLGRMLSDGSVELVRTQPGEDPVVTAATLRRVD